MTNTIKITETKNLGNGYLQFSVYRNNEWIGNVQRAVGGGRWKSAYYLKQNGVDVSGSNEVDVRSEIYKTA